MGVLPSGKVVAPGFVFGRSDLASERGVSVGREFGVKSLEEVSSVIKWTGRESVPRQCGKKGLVEKWKAYPASTSKPPSSISIRVSLPCRISGADMAGG